MLRAVNVNYLSLYTAATKWEINRLLRHLRLDDAELTAAAAAAAADDVVLTRDNSDGVFGVDNNSEQLSGWAWISLDYWRSWIQCVTYYFITALSGKLVSQLNFL